MRYPRIYQAVHFSPWLITPEAHASIVHLLNAKLDGGSLDEFPPAPAPELIGNLAVLPVKGVIGKGLSPIEQSCGAVDTLVLTRWVNEAIANPAVDSVLLDIDSPGGTANGTPELGEAIAAAGKIKPVFAWSDGCMGSAAYWIGSQARRVYASKSAMVGSIGTYIPFLDMSKAYEKEGLKRVLITSEGSDLKGAGYPGTALTKEQMAQIQEQVNALNSMFTTAVTSRRPKVEADTMRGQVFLAGEAQQRGLIDGIFSSREALIASLRG